MISADVDELGFLSSISHRRISHLCFARRWQCIAFAMAHEIVLHFTFLDQGLAVAKPLLGI
jgi:hypothetical protein